MHTSPMTPDEARDYIAKAESLGIAHHERRALDTVAAMTVRYRVEVTLMADGAGPWRPTSFEAGTRQECLDYLRLNEQLAALPDECVRITCMLSSGWLPDQ